MQPIKLRPHHLICACGFVGEGYSDSFIETFSNILDDVQQHHKPIKIVDGVDDICHACVHLCQHSCEYHEKVLKLDQIYKTVLRLQNGEILMWHDVRQRIKQHLSLNTFHETCQSCEWKGLGHCEKGLKQIIW